MQSNMFGIILTSESSVQLRELTYSRSVAAVPFAGRYRCVDFVLSNMVNSGITNVGLITQKNYHSLMDHLGAGKEWELRRKRDGLFILPPFVTRENTGIYSGTMDALKSVMGYIRRSTQKYVVLSGSHVIYNTTFHDMLRQHIDTGADITIMYNDTPPFSPADQYDDLRLTDMDEMGRVRALEVNPYHPASERAACDAFIMERTLLEYLIEESASRAKMDYIRDVLISKVDELRIYGWKYEGYVGRMNSLGTYYRHNMDVLDRKVRADLFNPEHPIYTKIKDEVPARYGKNAVSKNSLVADGCVVDGEIENSILFRGVHVGRGTKVKNCILMQATTVLEDCDLNYIISDKGVTINNGRRLAGYENFPVIIRKGSSV